MPPVSLACDGCGQPASPQHIARRLLRLEWTTRYRPIHISTLLLGGISPADDASFLYAGKFEGQAGQLLEAAGISREGKSAEMVLHEFQRAGLFLTCVLECPLEAVGIGQASDESFLFLRVPALAARIRRSLKPKRIVLISELLAPLLSKLTAAELGCPVLLDRGRPFDMDSSAHSEAPQRLREALAVADTPK